ncbi:MAG: hypothetical protein JXB30_04460 [Anaerolineae bacterium]|nr:hypothetical protein [Anaerolineae bacterium]
MRPAFLLAYISTITLALCLSACNMPIVAPAPTPRPTVIVITAVGPYFAAFDEPGDWLLGDSENSAGRIEGGEYLLTVKQPRMVAWTNQTRAFGDGIYEVDARLSSGPEASGFGLLLLGSSDMSSFFYCIITDDGRYDVGYCRENCGEEQSLIGGYKLSPAILTENQTNHLRVELANGRLNFLVNGALVSQREGITYSSGLVGLFGESAQYGGFEAAFDNLSVVEVQPANPVENATQPAP